ncbi:hypothetical protein [Streptomyces sp. rh34]|uniref:hypothetical protein n=1 Tax=Streptomyces sp. rh34 TaxID=2034272 RepID=UPI000BF0F7A3|nr:hypothetical protein [Streptomyces sp. rh34]
MDKPIEDLREMAAEGAGVIAMIESLRGAEDFTLTPLRLLLALEEAFGIPWTEARDLLVSLDPDLHPVGPAEDVERRFVALLERRA